MRAGVNDGRQERHGCRGLVDFDRAVPRQRVQERLPAGAAQACRVAEAGHKRSAHGPEEEEHVELDDLRRPTREGDAEPQRFSGAGARSRHVAHELPSEEREVPNDVDAQPEPVPRDAFGRRGRGLGGRVRVVGGSSGLGRCALLRLRRIIAAMDGLQHGRARERVEHVAEHVHERVERHDTFALAVALAAAPIVLAAAAIAAIALGGDRGEHAVDDVAERRGIDFDAVGLECVGEDARHAVARDALVVGAAAVEQRRDEGQLFARRQVHQLRDADEEALEVDDARALRIKEFEEVLADRLLLDAAAKVLRKRLAREPRADQGARGDAALAERRGHELLADVVERRLREQRGSSRGAFVAAVVVGLLVGIAGGLAVGFLLRVRLLFRLWGRRGGRLVVTRLHHVLLGRLLFLRLPLFVVLDRDPRCDELDLKQLAKSLAVICHQGSAVSELIVEIALGVDQYRDLFFLFLAVVAFLVGEPFDVAGAHLLSRPPVRRGCRRDVEREPQTIMVGVRLDEEIDCGRGGDGGKQRSFSALVCALHLHGMPSVGSRPRGYRREGADMRFFAAQLQASDLGRHNFPRSPNRAKLKNFSSDQGGT